MNLSDKELRLVFEMCASVCIQCKRELDNHGDIEVSNNHCGCYCHYRGLGGAENKCAAGAIWDALYEAKAAIKRKEGDNESD